MEEKQLLIICGEASGDLHAGNLVKEILKINPAIKISGVGGPCLREAGTQIIYDIKDLSAIGVFSVLEKLPKFLCLKKLILEKIKVQRFDLVILVDFSGFNLRLAKELKRKIPVIYYISPQVWASRRGRIKTIKKYITKLIVFFKFEEEFYKKYGIDVNFVGHPLLDIVEPTTKRDEFLNQHGLDDSKTIIALLPGSRKEEIKNILPIMLKTSCLIDKNRQNTQFLVLKSSQVDWDIYQGITHNFKIDLNIIEGKTYDCLQTADFCLVASGTATLETAIMGKPFVIIYKIGILNYLLYRPQIKVPYIGMVNIVAGKKIIPEFIQFQANPKKISAYIIKILSNLTQLAQIKNDLTQVKSFLGENGASRRAAVIISDFLNRT